MAQPRQRKAASSISNNNSSGGGGPADDEVEAVEGKKYSLYESEDGSFRGTFAEVSTYESAQSRALKRSSDHHHPSLLSRVALFKVTDDDHYNGKRAAYRLFRPIQAHNVDREINLVASSVLTTFSLPLSLFSWLGAVKTCAVATLVSFGACHPFVHSTTTTNSSLQSIIIIIITTTHSTTTALRLTTTGVVTVSAALVVVALCAELHGSTAYGKFGDTSVVASVDPRLGWWLMELPVTLSFVYFFFVKGEEGGFDENERVGTRHTLPRFFLYFFSPVVILFYFFIFIFFSSFFFCIIFLRERWAPV